MKIKVIKTKYKCKKCGYKHIEDLTAKKVIFVVLKSILISFVILTSIIGTTAIYNFIQGGINENLYIAFSLGGFYATITNFESYFKSNDIDELREIAINLTKDYEGDYNKSKAIYKHLLTFRYEEGENTNPLEIYKEKECDCDECSYLYKSLLSSINIHSILQCNNRHCWAIIKLQDRNILADITKYEWVEYGK